MYYMYVGMQKIFNVQDVHTKIWIGRIIFKEIKNPTHKGKEFYESKIEGYFKEISNYDLSEFLKTSVFYKKYWQQRLQ